MRLEHRVVPDSPWFWTDDTEMALSIGECLLLEGTIDPDLLARRFADPGGEPGVSDPVGRSSVPCGCRMGRGAAPGGLLLVLLFAPLLRRRRA
jgi:MYXO-CTERM domain-containing protein